MKALLTLLVILGCNSLANSKILSDGTYYLESVEYGSFWTACGSGCQYAFIENPHFDEFQRFIFTRLDNGYYTIIFEYIGKALTASPNSGLDVVFAKSVDPDAHQQQFKLIHRGGDNYMIKPRLYPSQAIRPDPIFTSLALDDKDCTSSIQLFKFVPYNPLENSP